MDGDLSAKLEQVLSDPRQMEKIAELAKGLIGQPPASQETGVPAGVPAEGERPAEPAGADARFLSAIGRAFAAGNPDKSRSTSLLLAMRPYMKPEKQEKLDRALQIARMAHIAGAVMREYGDGHGV